jgi:hypothetical protein
MGALESRQTPQCSKGKRGRERRRRSRRRRRRSLTDFDALIKNK